jgi:hypothetical protein
VLVLTGDGHPWLKERGPADDFSLWEDLGAPAISPATTPAAGDVPGPWNFISMWGAAHADGRIDVAGTAESDNDRGIFYRSRPIGGTAWMDWYPLGDNTFDGDIVAAVADDDSLEVATPVAVPDPGTSGETVTGMSHRRQDPSLPALPH